MMQPQRPSGAGCPCALVVSVLERLGAKHAAIMHRRGLHLPWSKSDWLMHFDEEERFIVPALRARGVPEKTLDFIVREHAFFRDELARHGKVISTEKLDRHARYEDDLVGKYLVAA